MAPHNSDEKRRPSLLAAGSVTGRRLLSGIQPSGQVHWGNYFGAMVQHVDLQDQGEGYYFIANYHSLTTISDAEVLRKQTRDVALDYLAVGLDPERATLYRQSDVPEVTELAWILACQVGMGDLERAVSYKDKVERGLAANAGLFTYPLLMAADILIVKGEIVPVGEDQLQHVEMTRRFATRFHTTFGCEVFAMPQARVTEAAIVPGLDGAKMSKSYGNSIPLFETKKRTKKKVMSIKTDSATVEEPKDPAGCTVFALLKLFAAAEEMAEWDARYRTGGTGYGAVKKRLAELAEAHIGPMRERRLALEKDPDFVEDVLRAGARRAREVAGPLMAEVREACGILKLGS